MKFGQVCYHSHTRGVDKVKYAGRISDHGPHILVKDDGVTVKAESWSVFGTKGLAEKYYKEYLKPMIVAHHGRELRKYTKE